MNAPIRVPARTEVMVKPIAFQSTANRNPSPSKRLYAANGARPLKTPMIRELRQIIAMAHENDLKLQSRRRPKWKKVVCSVLILVFRPRAIAKDMAIAESRAAVRLI